MSLDDLSLDSSEGAGASAEAPSEKSEKQREQSRKAQAQLQKTQKDEKKAKSDNDDLFLLLEKFILDPFFIRLISPITDLLKHEYPSRFVLSLIALIYFPASQYILGSTHMEEKVQLFTNLYQSDDIIPFDNDTLHPSLREWVTLWLTATEIFLRHDDFSVILLQKLTDLFEGEKRVYAVEGIAEVFRFFLLSRNIEIPYDKSRIYADFIIKQLQKSLGDRLPLLDPDLRIERSIDANSLFGLQ